jgi:hypothetical protein
MINRGGWGRKWSWPILGIINTIRQLLVNKTHHGKELQRYTVFLYFIFKETKVTFFCVRMCMLRPYVYVASVRLCCFLMFMLLPYVYVASVRLCCLRMFMLRPYVYVASVRLCCFLMFMLLPYVYVASVCVCCVRMFMLLPYVYVASLCSCCFRTFMLRPYVYVASVRLCCVRMFMSCRSGTNSLCTYNNRIKITLHGILYNTIFRVYRKIILSL